MADAPETVTEALTFLAAEGYRDELHLTPDGLSCPRVDGCHSVDGAEVDHQFRFEGPSDPGDEMIVLGISLAEWNLKGVLVSAFGPDTPPAQAALLTALARRPAR